VFRGQEDDVLDRYVQAAAAHRAAVVVRVTSDCPLIDPEVIDRVIYAFITEAPDYASNTLVRTYPRGLDTEVVAMPALTQAWREASAPYQREHVTPFITEQSGRFRLVSVTTPGDYSHWRWTVDAREDLEFVRMVYGRVGQAGHFGWVDIVDLLTQHPELAEINQGVPQKPLREASGG
jgi:spore coat polysaccharide biosynthesis protein SpsF